MFRRTFLSAVLASVAGVLGSKAQASRDGRTPKSVHFEGCRFETIQVWKKAPDREGRWLWMDNDGFCQIVSVNKSNGRLYAAWHDRKAFMVVVSLASEMGGDWTPYVE